jgi:Tol biopolymer transport system component/predicted Ser/Thr protein kinase
VPLPAGTQLGPYEILAPLGAGGMGEVYRAKDTKLNREVAIKVLPESLAHDPARLARFEREAKVLASLNHPNIAQIYGIENNALVMELVAGETLKIPAPLEYAKQIAEALEAAHEKGIIHRDLKPGNIMVTPAGLVKVLDFGLASVQVAGESDPTLTMAGAVIGTAAYMSPEQAAGKPLDKRTDIWSFGVVLFEMLAGRRLFTGESTSHILAEVLRAPIDIDKLEAPPKIKDLLRRCLDREVKNRLRDVGEARIAIASSATDPMQATPVGRRHALPWALASALALALLIASTLLYHATRPTPPRPLIRLNVEIAPDTPLARSSVGGGGMLALSPDGTRLALTLRAADGKVHLYTRLLNQSQATPLAGTDNASSPFFSPDSDWIGFFVDGKLKKISVEGGAAVTLCDATTLRGASWGDDGNIIGALSAGGILSRIPSVGGAPVPVTKLNPGEFAHRWPQVLPGSQAVLFTAVPQGGAYDDANIDVISLKTGERKTVGRGGFSPRYLAVSTRPGYLIYLHQSTLFAAPFEPARLVLTGAPTPILDDVSSASSAGGDFAFAQNGTFVYLAGKGLQTGWSISWVDRSGKTEPLHAPPGLYQNPHFSPDGKRLAFSGFNSGQGDDIWVKDLDRDAPSRLTFLPGSNRGPVWTPDGKNIVFRSINQAAPGMYWIGSDGSGEARRLTDGKLQEVPRSFSPDGRRLAFDQFGNSGTKNIFTAPVEGGGQLGRAELFVASQFNEVFPAFSPDGRWLAYQSNESGTYEAYVRPFPGPGGKWQVSTDGGYFPVWSHDGRELLFVTPDRRVMTVNYIAKGNSFAAGKPRMWSETRLRTTSDYDLAPDGKRLAAILPPDATEKPPTHLTFLLNFFDELRHRAP